MNKLILPYVCLLFMEVIVTAQEKVVRLFPEGAPGETVPMVEKISKDGNRVAGEIVCRITNVSDPTIAIYQPSEELAGGSAMIVCPGGGYDILAYDLEGDEVCLLVKRIGNYCRIIEIPCASP